MRTPILNEEQRECVRALRGEDPKRWTHAQLAHRFGVSPSTIEVVLRPELLARRRARTSEWHQRNAEVLRGRSAANVVKVQHVDLRERIERDAREHLKKIPEDTRTYTQRFFGDPLPGRSALDRRAGG